jgi:uncharacterized protein YkwD
MVIEEINEYRLSIGLKELYTSKVLKEVYSCVTATINAKQNKLFHTGFNVADKNCASMLYNELFNLSNGNCGRQTQTIISMHSGEIIASTNEYFETYEYFAKYLVGLWLNSPGHKKIITTDFLTQNGVSGQISCCIQKSVTGSFYAAVGFVDLIYFPGQ